jgi:two-component system NtrC family sensor kinase
MGEIGWRRHFLGMTDAFYQLPTTIILGALVLILAAMRRQNHTPRFRMWLLAWVLLFLRSALQISWQRLGIDRQFYAALDMGILMLSSILFCASVSIITRTRERRTQLLVSVTLPMVVYAVMMAYGVASPWPYILCLLVAGAAAALLRYLIHENTGFAWTFIAVVASTGLWTFFQVLNGQVRLGYYTALAFSYAMAAVLFYRSYRRWTPGVTAAAIGFSLWSLSIPGAYVAQAFGLPGAFKGDLWNTPKFIVAIGMIVTLLEDERLAAEAARLKERVLNSQMRRFAELTSRLLSGVEISGFAGEVAQVLGETTIFRKVAIFLLNDQGRMTLAGASGYEDELLRKLEERFYPSATDGVDSIFSKADPVGSHSFLDVYAGGLEVLIPLRSQHHAFLGAVSLSGARAAEVAAEDISAVEIFAAELAVAVENASLQKQLFRSERLAGMGKLVAGVAHELNNPLTAVLGYTELLEQKLAGAGVERELEVMRRESLRMKRIIENLQRFARQQRVAPAPIGLQALIRDVLKLRAYDIQSRQVEVQARIPDDLPRVLGEESLLIQVLLHVLSNALDALEQAPLRRVVFEAEASAQAVTLRIYDSGPGFADLQRVFDPFYTTKGPAKGPGLGLSLSYAVIRDMGGEITASNLERGGACITLTLPVAPAAKEIPSRA